MATGAADFSEAFAATAREEADRLRARALEVRARAERWLQRGQELLGEAERFESRVRELDEMLGRAPQLRVDLQTPALQGQQLREAALQILADRIGMRQPIHYRDWYRLLTEAGHVAGGKDPLATFLTQITRSPVVQRVDGKSGIYEIDPKAAYDQAREELAAAAREFADEQARLAQTSESANGQDHLKTVRVAGARLAQAQRKLDAVVAARSSLLRERLSSA